MLMRADWCSAAVLVVVAGCNVHSSVGVGSTTSQKKRI